LILPIACVFILKQYSGSDFINIGLGEDIPISDLARMIAEVVGYSGEIVYDPSKPDGTPRKLVDVSRLKALGWTARTTLQEGLEKSYADFLQGNVRER